MKTDYKIQTLPTQSESNHLYYRNTEKADIAQLQIICNSWTDKLKVEGEAFATDYLNNCIENGDLPPIENAKKGNYSIKTICRKNDYKIIGFFDIYHGYPSPEILWISMFLIDNHMQKSGYGSEIVELLSLQAKENGFSAMGLGVHLKNWKGLRFWIKNGFDTITGISSGNEFGTNKFSVIKLGKSF